MLLDCWKNVEKVIDEMKLDVRKYANGNLKAGIRIRRDIRFLRTYMKAFMNNSFKYDKKIKRIKEIRKMVKTHGKEKIKSIVEEIKKEEESKK